MHDTQLFAIAKTNPLPPRVWRRRIARTVVLSATLISVCQAQSAPELTTSVFTMSQIAEDPTVNLGDQVVNLISGAYSEPDSGDATGIAIVAADVTNGSWEYTTDNTASPVTWIPFGAVSDDHALLLSFATAVYSGQLPTAIRFNPNASFNGTSSGITFHAWDETTGTPSASVAQYGNLTSPTGFASIFTGGTTSYGTVAATASITVTPVNDAPVLDPSGDSQLIPVAFGASNDPGTSMTQLLSTGAGGDPIADPDLGDTRGVAIIDAAGTSFGSWQYTLDGGTNWIAFPVLSPGQALVLVAGLDMYGASTDHRVRFIPSNPAFTGSISNALTFLAWDQHDNSFGGMVTTPGGRGAGSAYSITAEIASIAVTGSLPPTQAVVSIPQLPVSGSGAARYGAICPSTPQGILSLEAALNGKPASEVRAFSWDAITQAFVEFPRHPTAGLVPSTGVFIATRSALPVDFDGTPSALPFSVILEPGWNLIGIPPLDDGAGNILVSHPWDDFQLLDDAAAPINGVSAFVDVLGTPGSGILTTTRPWSWDGASYGQVTTLMTGTGYWIKNNASTNCTLVRTGSAATPGPRLAGGSHAARGTITDRGTPPALPASSRETQSRGCGMASGLGTFVLLLMAAFRQGLSGRTAHPRHAKPDSQDR